MLFVASIACDNAAFDDDPRHEVARILRDLATQIETGIYSSQLHDVNGNSVGQAGFITDRRRKED